MSIVIVADDDDGLACPLTTRDGVGVGVLLLVCVGVGVGVTCWTAGVPEFLVGVPAVLATVAGIGEGPPNFSAFFTSDLNGAVSACL